MSELEMKPVEKQIGIDYIFQLPYLSLIEKLMFVKLITNRIMYPYKFKDSPKIIFINAYALPILDTGDNDCN